METELSLEKYTETRRLPKAKGEKVAEEYNEIF
jgi:hypothetical protein